MINLIPRAPKSELYRKAFDRKLELLNESIKGGDTEIDDITSIIFLGVKSFAASREDYQGQTIEYISGDYRVIESLKAVMSFLTPRQFINIFPVIKEYDGDKYETKDYFYTMNMVKEIGLDTQIGEKIDEFLWDYHNHDIRLFVVKSMSLMSDIMRAQGRPGLMEQFSADFGIPLYYSNKDDKEITGPVQIKKVGDTYCYDDSGARTVPLKKKRPRYLKAVPGKGVNG